MRITIRALRVASFVPAVSFAPAVALVVNATTTASFANAINLTYPGAIDCNPGGAAVINDAFYALSHVLAMAMNEIEIDDHYPPFLAMFRRPSNMPDVLQFLQRLLDLSPNPSMTVQTRPRLACAEPGTPLDVACQHLPYQEDLFVNLTSNTVVLCTLWFNRPQDPAPMQCPAVDDNQFQRNAQGSVFGASRSTRMMEGLVGLYLGLDQDLRLYPSLRALFALQEAMKRPFYQMASAWGNIVGFLSRESEDLSFPEFSPGSNRLMLFSPGNAVEMNECTMVPDISRPPWVKPRSSNTSNVEVA